MLPVDFDAHADRLFDLLEVFVFVCRAKRDTLTASACSCRPSDAVNISVGFERHIEVDDMADLIDVDPSGGDIGGDEHTDLPRAEIVQDPLPGVLRPSSVDTFGSNPIVDE